MLFFKFKSILISIVVAAWKWTFHQWQVMPTARWLQLHLTPQTETLSSPLSPPCAVCSISYSRGDGRCFLYTRNKKCSMEIQGFVPKPTRKVYLAQLWSQTLLKHTRAQSPRYLLNPLGNQGRQLFTSFRYLQMW